MWVISEITGRAIQNLLQQSNLLKTVTMFLINSNNDKFIYTINLSLIKKIELIIYNKLNMLKGVLYFKLENFSARVLGPLLRNTG